MYRSDRQFMRNPATAHCRIYIGSIADAVVAADLEEKFKEHGKILGLLLQKGFGFIQYENESQAQAAIQAEHNKFFHGRKLNVKPTMDKGRGPNSSFGSQGKTPENTTPTPTFEKPSPLPSLFDQQILPPKQHLNENQNNDMDTDVIHIDDSSLDKGELENDPFATSDTEEDVRKKSSRFSAPFSNQNRGRTRDNFSSRDMQNQHGEGAFRSRGDRGELHRDQGELHRGRGELHRGRGELHRGRIEGRGGRGEQRGRGDNNDLHGHEDYDERGSRASFEPPEARNDSLHRERVDIARERDGPTFFGREEPFQNRPAPVFMPPPAIDRPERNDCEIIVVAKALTEYAEFIERKLKSMGLEVDLLFPNEDIPIGRVLANISSRGCLFAILVMPQNEEFRSLTLNVLHGIPQEHRNMPIEDALLFISRNLDSYMRGVKLGGVPSSVVGMLGERHPEQIQILCNLLSENRQITTAQYDRLIKYLQERREIQSQYEIAESGAELTAEGEPNIKQAELQNRIMNILNKSTDEPPKPIEAPVQNQAAGPPPLLKDPSVQKALDSLLSGDMFKSISTSGF